MAALVMLESADRVAAEADRQRELKLALLAGGHLTLAEAFPELVPEGQRQAEAAPDGDVDYDYSQVEWRSPSDVGGIDDFARMQQVMDELKTFTTAEAPDPVSTPLAMEPDDPEWT